MRSAPAEDGGAVMEHQVIPPGQARRWYYGDDPVGPLAELQSALADLLAKADDDPRSLDSNSERAHQLVTDTCRRLSRTVFSPGGPLDPLLYKQAYDALIATRDAERDMYEVYVNDLECYRERAVKGLRVTESDSDRLALVRRRRKYIPRLLAFHVQTMAILEHLRERR
jgi:hypothetical protein